MRPYEKSPGAAQLVRQDAASGARGIAALDGRLERYSKARRRSSEMVAYLRGCDYATDYCQPLADRMAGCGSYLLFRHYYTVDQLRLSGASFCCKHLTCPLCAIRRGAKMLKRYIDRYSMLNDKGGFVPYLVTLTVANGPNLNERFRHIKTSYRKLIDRRRDVLKKGRGTSALANVVGLVGSFEVTNKGNGWHPHCHLVCLVPKGRTLDATALSKEWQRHTGDSYIVDVREMYGEPADAFCEVFKYALKFSDLTHAQNVEAAMSLNGARLVVSLGVFRGIPDTDILTDDIDEELDALPYVELLYRHIGGVYRQQGTKKTA